MSEGKSRPIWLRLGLFIVIFMIGVGVAYQLLQPELPVYHPSQLDLKLVDAEVLKKKGEHRILDFELTDQTGATITQNDIKGKVIVADFFFTTCKTICPIMTNQMARVQDEFLKDDRLVLLSHSVTPEIDTVGRLQEYADIHDVDPNRWHLLTGPRPHINNLARRSYFACLTDGDGDEYDLVHTENFVLVDTLGRIRGFYDGTNEEEVDRLIRDIPKLY